MSKPISERKHAASRRNLEKAWQANRTHWEKTPARLANARRTIQLAIAANRRVPRKLSPAQVEAARRNVARARAALARRGRTPEHLAKLRETIQRARAARTPASLRLHNERILRHGVFVRSVRQTLHSLGQDVRDVEGRMRLLRRYFGLKSTGEENTVRALAELFWRHERLYYAQAVWEADALDAVLTRTPAVTADLEADDLRLRAYALLEALSPPWRFFELDRRMTGSAGRLMRRLLRARYGPNFQFQMHLRGSPEDSSSGDFTPA